MTDSCPVRYLVIVMITNSQYDKPRHLQGDVQALEISGSSYAGVGTNQRCSNNGMLWMVCLFVCSIQLIMLELA
ncbi:hypothetical protein RRG08_031674 [Elysia crispata]|uniref:Uncharacterized protein n=1 Tax=Elysia crispata TaxID=231223 RepID=A0AAE0Z525_9GAST|nr:hypothetical protein RRG08_031674 [Elysia crispata]